MLSIKTEPVFDVGRHSPSIAAALARRVPGLEAALERLRSAIPLPDRIAFGQHGPFIRLRTHYRSVCLGLGHGEWTNPSSVQHVIVLKGTEPALADFERYLQWMMTRRFRQSELTVGLHFPLALRMPPGAMPIDESVREQQISTAFQTRHLEEFGELARTPVPLLTHRMSADVVDAYLERLRRVLPAQALERVEPRVRAGLGVSVCYYDGLPLRVADLERREDHSSANDPDLSVIQPVIESWIELFARMLALGYVPYAHWNKGWGACVDKGNACVNGGFADLLTLVALATIPNPRILRASVWGSLNLLIETITAFWTVIRGGTADEEVKTLVGLLVRHDLRRSVDRLEAAGHALDGRIRACLAVDSLQELASLTAAMRTDAATDPDPTPPQL